MKWTPAGEMRHPVVIFRLATVQDASGEQLNTPVAVTTNRAKIATLSGQALMVASQVNKESTHQINMPFLSVVNDEMVIGFGKRRFEINSLNNIEERNREHLVIAK